MMLRWLRGVGLVLMLAACAPNMEQGDMDTGRDNQTEPQGTFRFERDSYGYLRDEGRFGWRNANPGLAVGEWQNPSSPPDDVDRRRIRESAMTIDGVRDVDVQVLGGHAAVKVTPQPGYPESRYEELQEKVLRRISYEMPRYEVRVRVGWSKWNPLSHLPFFRDHAG
jgi:hypothetical protein